MVVQEPLEVSFHGRTRLRPVIQLGVVVVALVAAWWFDLLADWLAAVCLAAFVLLVVVGVRTRRAARVDRRAARLDARGISIPGAALVPWSELTEVVVGPMHPVWLVGTRQVQIVSFIPRPGVDLPGPPQPGGRPQAWGRPLRERLYKTNLLLLASATDVEGERIAAAAHDLGGLPVRHEPGPGVRTWAIVVAVAILLGVVITLVRHLLG